MNPNTVLHLNQLNREFYQQTANSFDQTRQYSWQGWQKLLPFISQLATNHQPLTILDLGCGNARFAGFLQEQALPVKYHGVDFSQDLLQKAKDSLTRLKIEYQLTQLDIVQQLIDGKLPTTLNQQYNLIVAFGVLHHIPSFQLRAAFFQQLATLLQDHQAKLIVSAWQFATKDRFKKKMINPTKIGIDPKELENNDYILDWQQHPTAFRYCHHLDQAELEQLLSTVKTVQLEETFLADGKSGQLNRYLVLSAK